MKLKISHKLFIANLGIILALVLIMLGVSYVSSKNILNDFILSHIAKDLKGFSVVLSQYYEKEGSWDKLVQDKQKWSETIHNHLQELIDFPVLPKKPSSNMPVELAALQHHNTEKIYSEPSDIFVDRVSLLDRHKVTLISAKILGHSYKYQSIQVNNQTVGWLILGVPKFNKMSIANDYLEQQLMVSLWVAVVGIFIAALFSFGLSRHITFPIKMLTQGAQKLSERNFNTHITINTNDEFFALAESFNHISHELLTYEKKQKQWLMDISHELRTPLTILQGEFSAISDGVTKYSPYIINSLKEEVSNIHRLVNDLNDLSITESLGFHCLKEKLNLSKLLCDNLNRYKSKLLSRQISIHIDLNIDNVLVLGDADRLSQVFANLLENSFRYIQSPGRLWVEAEVTENQVYIMFSDSGPGVSEQALEQLFNRLYRTESSRNRKTGGAGLGLAICKNIITAHSGEIKAKSTDKGGLCIYITLPTAEY